MCSRRWSSKEASAAGDTSGKKEDCCYRGKSAGNVLKICRMSGSSSNMLMFKVSTAWIKLHFRKRKKKPKEFLQYLLEETLFYQETERGREDEVWWRRSGSTFALTLLIFWEHDGFLVWRWSQVELHLYSLLGVEHDHACLQNCSIGWAIKSVSAQCREECTMQP